MNLETAVEDEATAAAPAAEPQDIQQLESIVETDVELEKEDKAIEQEASFPSIQALFPESFREIFAPSLSIFCVFFGAVALPLFVFSLLENAAPHFFVLFPFDFFSKKNSDVSFLFSFFSPWWPRTKIWTPSPMPRSALSLTKVHFQISTAWCLSGCFFDFFAWLCLIFSFSSGENR